MSEYTASKNILCDIIDKNNYKKLLKPQINISNKCLEKVEEYDEDIA